MTLWQRFLCNVLGWHRPSLVMTFDGCSMGSYCRRCGRRILQDSNGDWFAVRTSTPHEGGTDAQS